MSSSITFSSGFLPSIGTLRPTTTTTTAVTSHSHTHPHTQSSSTSVTSLTTANNSLTHSLTHSTTPSLTTTLTTTPSDRRDRQLNYKKAVVTSVHHIECRCLYRVLMKIEIPFRGLKMKSNRHRFVKLLYHNACHQMPDYESIIGFIKQHLGLYISLHDARQLVLYSALFGPTDICDIPTNEDTIRVIKSCPLSVPPFVNFKKWSRDVKRLEAHPLSVDISKGYFSHFGSGGSECVTIMSLRDDFREFDEQGQYSDTSSDSEDGESNSDSDSDNDNEETMRSKEENRKRLEDLFSPQMDDKRFFSQSKSLSMGSGIFSDDGSQSERRGSEQNRKKGLMNLYERSDNHNLNKMILALSRGESGPVVENEATKGELAHRFSKVFLQEKEASLSRCNSIKEMLSSDDDDEDIDCSRKSDAEVDEATRLKMVKVEKERKERQKIKIAKLTNFTSLRPSLAKLDMIRRLRRQRRYEQKVDTVGLLSSTVDPKSDRGGSSTSDLIMEEFKLMSM